jgi:peptidyl-prolyl cis-trans isomerase D
VLIAIIAIVFVFYFGYSFKSDKGAKIATVNGELISGQEYKKTYHDMLKTLQQQYGKMWSENLIEVFDLKNRALQQLIEEKLLTQEAERIGLGVTDEELKGQILQYPAFQYQGRFDERRYRMVLNQNRMKPEDFEITVKQILLREKISQLLMAFLPATEQELREHYTYKNRQVKVKFFTLEPIKYRESVEITESGLSKYFIENIDKYRVPDKLSVTYIDINPQEYIDEANITDEDVSIFYEENIEQYKVKKEIHARHILFTLEEGADDQKVEEVKKKAGEILEKARKGENFAELAKEYSEGPSKDKGGDLGYFSAGQMVKPFEEAAFKMKPGEISDLVRTPFGYHIIKAEDVREARTRPLEEVREEIKERIRLTEATNFAHEKALSLMDQMPYDVDLEDYAKGHGVKAEKTAFFSRAEDIPDIIGDDKLREVIFSLKPQAVSDVLEYGGHFYIFQKVEEKPSFLPDIEDVREKVNEDYIRHLSLEKAKKAAQSLLDRLKNGEEWEVLLKKEGLEERTSDFFKRGGAILGIGYVQGLDEAAFQLGEEKRYSENVFESGSGFHVIRWEAFKDIDEDEFQDAIADEANYVRNLKHRQLFGLWLDELTKKAEIEKLIDL